MSAPLRLSALVVLALTLTAGALEAVVPAPETAVDYATEAAACAVRALADAGRVTSDGGREVTEDEADRILTNLAVMIDYAASKIPDDALSVRVPIWLPLAASGVSLWLPDDGPPVVAVIRALVASLASEARDGEISADDLRRILRDVRDRIASARA